MEFKKIIFERGKFFTFEIMVLHDKNQLPDILPLGKIAGIQQILISKPPDEKGESFWSQLTSGSIFIHLIRLFAYPFILILLIFVIAIPSVMIADSVGESKRRNKIDKIWNKNRTTQQQLIADIYIKNGLVGIQAIGLMLDNPNRLQRLAKVLGPSSKHGNLTGLIERYYYGNERGDDVRYMHEAGFTKNIANLIEEGVITSGPNGQVSVDPDFKKSLEDFIRLLKID